MSDLEICKRIAEIEGVDFECGYNTKNSGGCYRVTKRLHNGRWLNRESYNPLIDDGLCFKLMVKYRISLHYDTEGMTNPYVCFHNKVLATQLSRDTSPNKAILLAIIEAHKDNNNG